MSDQMSVISGIYKKRTLSYPKNIRPSTQKHKKMVFDTIKFDLPDSKFLDLFSGSGQMGIEALSNGASHCTFVDQASVCYQTIKTNIENAKIPKEHYNIINQDVQFFLHSSADKYDIIMADPPYMEIDWKKLSQIHKVSHPGTILIIKYCPQNPPPDFRGWQLIKTKDCNDTIINFYLAQQIR